MQYTGDAACEAIGNVIRPIPTSLDPLVDVNEFPTTNIIVNLGPDPPAGTVTIEATGEDFTLAPAVFGAEGSTPFSSRSHVVEIASQIGPGIASLRNRRFRIYRVESATEIVVHDTPTDDSTAIGLLTNYAQTYGTSLSIRIRTDMDHAHHYGAWWDGVNSRTIRIGTLPKDYSQVSPDPRDWEMVEITGSADPNHPEFQTEEATDIDIRDSIVRAVGAYPGIGVVDLLLIARPISGTNYFLGFKSHAGVVPVGEFYAETDTPSSPPNAWNPSPNTDMKTYHCEEIPSSPAFSYHEPVNWAPATGVHGSPRCFPMRLSLTDAHLYVDFALNENVGTVYPIWSLMLLRWSPAVS